MLAIFAAICFNLNWGDIVAEYHKQQEEFAIQQAIFNGAIQYLFKNGILEKNEIVNAKPSDLPRLAQKYLDEIVLDGRKRENPDFHDATIEVKFTKEVVRITYERNFYCIHRWNHLNSNGKEWNKVNFHSNEINDIKYKCKDETMLIILK